jgi:hypothetical protein
VNITSKSVLSHDFIVNRKALECYAASRIVQAQQSALYPSLLSLMQQMKDGITLRNLEKEGRVLHLKYRSRPLSFVPPAVAMIRYIHWACALGKSIVAHAKSLTDDSMVKS